MVAVDYGPMIGVIFVTGQGVERNIDATTGPVLCILVLPENLDKYVSPHENMHNFNELQWITVNVLSM